ncbi:putative haloacid dehalogenase-like hydrolase [Pseudomassariella vexata]|uniref:Putative haloacid dehalogenase-like hydrolase n=1 Tax=Pseudomassariella vexata TaxID=1141098 RepID=A0A1Y2E2U9_9PEZI|nr:putative haloacid dehalogenase-like hydrolase [Pseudomassariella vexata]ORY65777.1 putative haloacid dehalogenase-like hydrolase [Pseudomassariella vexata]
MPSVKLVIFDFEGTLFDTQRSISHCIKLTFDALLPSKAPSEPKVHRLISSGAGLMQTFKSLHPDPSSLDEEKWTATYRAIYAKHGQPLIAAFTGTKELLTALRQRGILAAIISNKGVAAVSTALKNNGMENSIPEDLIIGDKTPGATRKPDSGSYVNVLLPALKARGHGDFDPASVLVVGDTMTDIKFAANIRARSVWCRYGYGNRVECEKLIPNFAVSSLKGVITILDLENDEPPRSA